MAAGVVDGNDVLAVREAAREAVRRARTGGGPTLLECRTYRHKGHSKVDPGTYRPRDEVQAWVARDPIPRLAALMDDDEVEQLHDEAEEELEGVLTAARAAGYPDPERRSTAFRE
jgi:pyruvate dehydrogenase E1 component alpha subunit